MKNKTLNKFPFVLFRILLPDNDYDYAIGDIVESYEQLIIKKGKIAAYNWLLLELLRSLPRLLKRSISSGGAMIRNYFLLSLRNIFKNKLFSSINIFGLAAGIACTILILLWVQDETSFDEFNENKESIYRVVGDWQKWNWVGFEGTPGILSPAAKEAVPEIVNSVRIGSQSRKSVKFGEQVFYEAGGIYADKSLFEIFSFKIKSGELANAFSNPENILISESMANKYFGDLNPLGKTLEIEGEDFNVAAVFYNPPANSHLQFDFINSFEKLKKTTGREFSWDSFNYVTYLQVADPHNTAIVGEKITELGLTNNCAQISQGAVLRLEPLKEIYLNPRSYSRSFMKLSNSKYIYIFSAAAVFILLIACLNFINLTTAKASNRAREIGVRKALGAVRKQLINQFYTETFVLAFLAFVTGLAIVLISMPFFNNITGKELNMDFMNPQNLFILFVIALVVTLFSGTYPALYLSSFAPSLVLKGEVTKSKKAAAFRNVMTVFQFTISIVLIIGATLLYQQSEFIRTKDLGFDKENVITIPLKENLGSKYESAKNILLNKPGVVSVTAHKNDFSKTSWHTTVKWKENGGEQTIDLVLSGVDVDFFKTMGMEIIEGRGFSEGFISEQNKGAYVINQAAITKYGMTKPVGRILPIPDWENQIIGVVNNAHFKSLHEEISPRLYYIGDFTKPSNEALMFIRVNGNDLQNTIAEIEEVWNSFNTKAPFEYNFLDERFEKLYKAEKITSSVVNSFTLIAILISCLGLFGLSSFMIEKRKKEIAIKKVLGAKTSSLINDTVKQFLYWIILSSLIAYPLAFYIGNQFLEEYAYKIDLTIEVFFFSTLVALFVAYGTVFFQTLKAALANPINSIKYE